MIELNTSSGKTAVLGILPHRRDALGPQVIFRIDGLDVWACYAASLIPGHGGYLQWGQDGALLLDAQTGEAISADEMTKATAFASGAVAHAQIMGLMDQPEKS